MNSQAFYRRAGAVSVLAFCFLIATLGMGTCSASAADTDAGFDPGLLYEVYKLPRRPKTIRNLLPGVPPVSVGLLDGLHFTKEQGFDGPKESIQMEIFGQLHVPEDGQYTFDLNSDDGVEIYLDDKFLAKDAWVNGSKPPSRGERELKKGWVDLHARFYQGDGGAGLTVKWKTPGSDTFEPIPADAFRVSTKRVEAAKDAMAHPDTIEGEGEGDKAYRAIFLSDGFFELPEAEGDLMVDLLEGPTTYSAACRKDLNNYLKAIQYDKLPYWHQLKALSGYLRGWPTESTERGPVPHRDAYKVSDQEAVTYDGWNGAKREGFVQTIAFEDGHTVTLYTPVKDALERTTIPKALAGLPAVLRDMLDEVTVEPYGTAREFNGGGNHFWVRLQGPAELGVLDSTFSHEIGHVLMNKTDCYLDWEKAVNQDILSVSHYGRLNPSEDFAEFTRLYLGTNGNPDQLASLHKLFPARMAVMEHVLGEVGFSWHDFQATHE